MFEQLLAITRNTFFESIRQPIYFVVLLTASLLIVLANPLAAFTLDNDQRMLIDIGLATVFAAGTVLAAFIATNVIGHEIANKTALTVISKPISRPVFVIGKYLGVAAALMLATLALSLVFLLVELHGVRQRVVDPYHMPVIIFGSSAFIIGMLAATWCNYFYGKVFVSTAVCVTTPLLAVAYLLCLPLRFDFSYVGLVVLEHTVRPQLWMALACVAVAILVLTAIAVAVSTRLGQVLTLTATLGVFMLGMLADWFFGRPIHYIENEVWKPRAVEQGMVETREVERTIHLVSGETNTMVETVTFATVPLTQFAEGREFFEYAAYHVGYALLPNFQVLWLSDALTQEHVIPIAYVLTACLYGLLYVVAAIGVGIILFQRREVG